MKLKDAVVRLNQIFEQLKMKAEVIDCKEESPFLIFDVALLPGGTFRKLERNSTEIALALQSISVPLIYPLTTHGVVRMEIMVAEQENVMFSNICKNENHLSLPLDLGKLRDGSILSVDLSKMPHLLIGGTTGSGKSILLHTIVNSLMLNSNCDFALVDTKRVEFSYYDSISRLFGPIARDVDSAILLFQELISEMENRFKVLEENGCRDISEYHNMKYIVVVIDELADLMMIAKKDMQKLICRLAQKSRACGIHLVAATQRPSADVVTGIIKANFPSRIRCQVSSATDSRTILDAHGAEKLIGKGDAIINTPNIKFKRFKGAFISQKEIKENVLNNQSWWREIWTL